MEADLVVVGGGIAGICGALQAGRLGLRTVLVEKEWLLGGLAGPMMGIGWGGALRFNEAWDEVGIVEELTERIFHAGVLFSDQYAILGSDPRPDEVMARTLAEAGVTVLRRHAVIAARTEPAGDGYERRIRALEVLNLENLDRFDLAVTGLVLDASGDAAVAAAAGADLAMGRESRDQTGERSAPEEADDVVSAASITALTVDTGVACPFTPPPGTPRWNPDKPANTFHPDRRLNVLFQVDGGGDNERSHPIHSPQELYLRLRAHLWSMWDYMKNVQYPQASLNHRLLWISPLLGRRESRRVLGDYVLSQTDCETAARFPDSVGFVGAGLDYHPPSADGGYETIFYSEPTPADVPFRCLYSRNVANLLVGGRCVSATHLAFTALRLIRTGGMLGQAAGAAAKLCIDHHASPRQVAAEHLDELQQLIIRHDGWIPGVAARGLPEGDVTASSEATLGRDAGGGELWAADDGIAATIHSYPERLESFGFHLENPAAEDVEIELSAAYGQTPSADWPEVRERAAGEAYEFRHASRPRLDFRCLATFSRTVPAGFSGWVDVRLDPAADLPAYDRGHFAQALRLSVTGPVEVLAAPHGLDTVDPVDGPVPVFRIAPEPVPGRAANVLDGHIHREGLARLHAWVSQPGEAMPQWLELRLAAPRRVRTILLTFDTTERFRRAHFAERGDLGARRCSADYRLEIPDGDGGWRVLLRQDENFRRFRSHVLDEAVEIQALRLVVERVRDPRLPARVAQICLLDT